MAYTEYDGVIINKVTLAKYKELKAAGQIVDSQSYVITDLDDYLDLYWQLREGKIIPTDKDYLFLNSEVDMSNIPVDTIIYKDEGSNNQVYCSKIVLENGVYKFNLYMENGIFLETTFSGTSLSAMTPAYNYVNYTTEGYGLWARIKYIHPEFLKIIDNVWRINNNDF